MDARDIGAEPGSAKTPRGVSRLLAATGRGAVRYRRAVLSLAAMVTLLCALAGYDVAARLVSGGFVPESAPSAQALRAMEDFGGGAPGFVLLARAEGGVDTPGARRAGERLVSRLLADSRVSGVDSYWTGAVRGAVPRRPGRT